MEIEQKANNPSASREVSSLLRRIRAQSKTKKAAALTNKFREATALFYVLNI